MDGREKEREEKIVRNCYNCTSEIFSSFKFVRFDYNILLKTIYAKFSFSLNLLFLSFGLNIVHS